MKKYLFYLLFAFFLIGCNDVENRIGNLEKKVLTLEERVRLQSVIRMAQQAGANFYPARGFTGGAAGDLDNIANPSDKDVAFVALNDDGTYGNAVFIYSFDGDASAGESVPTIIAPDTGSGEWELVTYYQKLDDFQTPDDNTDLNVSTSAHGLMPKLPNDATQVIDGTGTYVDIEDLADEIAAGIAEGEYADDTVTGADIKDGDVTYLNLEGTYKSSTPMTDDCDNFLSNFTGDYLYGGTFLCNAAGTCTLPAVTAGMNFTIITVGAIACVIDPNANDSMLTDGTQQSDGENITNTSTAGDIAVVQYLSAAGWLTSTNGWTQE